MYLLDFLSRAVKKSNIPVFIYLVLNVIFIKSVLDMPLIPCLAVYFVSLLIALSPIGEWILRLQVGGREIRRAEQKELLIPLFDEVYARAKELDPLIPDGVELYISNEKTVNAYATGRKSICVTEGLLWAPKSQVKAVLAHEMGHLANRDTDLILLVSVGNFLATVVLTVIKLIMLLFEWAVADYSGGFLSGISLLISDGLIWIWTKIGTLIVMSSSRSNEYAADEYALKLGYGDSLCAFLDAYDDSAAKGLFAVLESSHPDKNFRIAKLQELGANYRQSY